MHRLRYRQVHLDFHTSPDILGIGKKFNRKQWQDALQRGHVASITCFAVCHHGWNYNDTVVGRRHPHLSFDLLRAQFDASKEIDVNVPIYITAGLSDRVAAEHPEWRPICPDGSIGHTSSPLQAGFRRLCFNSPYTDYLCRLISEVACQFPGCDGIFLDIISQPHCCCGYCLRSMDGAGLDPESETDRDEMSRRSLERYYALTTAAARCNNPEMPVFHNSGHLTRGDRGILKYFSHLELESLPTGGWGYDHFPVSAKYCMNLDLDFMGMTGKFHTTWGEFGGYKHPNALRYECSAMLAYGAKCSVGDQLHPSGEMDTSTYDLIGTAYAEVEQKEPWCMGASSVADIGLLSSDAMSREHKRENEADDGAARVLLEGQFLFDVIDAGMPFDDYAMLILPDDVRVHGQAVEKLQSFLAGGGKLLLTGTSGMHPGEDRFAFDIGADCEGGSSFQPDFVLPVGELAPDFLRHPLVMYLPSQRIKVRPSEGSRSLGEVFDPYFNRGFRHYFSHQHAPPRLEPSGYDCGVVTGNIMYLAHPVFSQYRATGAVAHKEYVRKAIDLFLGDDRTLTTNLPSTARVTLMYQAAENRHVLHLLYANTVNRGGSMHHGGGNISIPTKSVEVIEDLVPLHGTEVTLRLPRSVKRVTLEPEGRECSFSGKAGEVSVEIDRFQCHQMVAFEHE